MEAAGSEPSSSSSSNAARPPPAAASPPSAAPSAAEPSSSGRDKREYLEEKYGSKEAHVNLTSEEVSRMLDRVLATSPTVQYLMESLRLVRLFG